VRNNDTFVYLYLSTANCKRRMSDLKLEIHPAASDDERSACLEIMASSKPWVTLGMTLSNLTETISDPLNQVYAAYVGEEIVGTMVIQTVGDFSGYLKSIAVKQGWRSQKLGERMMAFIEQEIFSSCANLFVCVSSFNRGAQRFYLRRGYEMVGTLNNFLVEGYDEILMRKTEAPLYKAGPAKQPDQ
jgi:[ribosomal protein S18]-alanine N-acetyltransferase